VYIYTHSQRERERKDIHKRQQKRYETYEMDDDDDDMRRIFVIIIAAYGGMLVSSRVAAETDRQSAYIASYM